MRNALDRSCRDGYLKEVGRNTRCSHLKMRFPFIYASTSLDTKRLTIALNRYFESCLSIPCLAPRHISGFSILTEVFPLPLAILPNIVSSNINAPLSNRDKKNVSVMVYFSQEILIHR